jgi:hypothetical protein
MAFPPFAVHLSAPAAAPPGPLVHRIVATPAGQRQPQSTLLHLEVESAQHSLRELVRIASKAYNDDENPNEDKSTWDEVIDSNGRLVARGKLGDTLAEFIILELAETY